MVKQKKKVGRVVVITKDYRTTCADPDEAAQKASALVDKTITAKSVCYCCDKGTSKYGISFCWDDPAVVLSRRAVNSRRKGNTFETEIAAKLREIGYVGCKTSRAESRLADANHIDIVDTDGLLPVDIQCKYMQVTPNYYAIKEGCRSSRPFCVIWKKATSDGSHSPGTLAMIDIDFFYELLKIYYIQNNVDKDSNAKPRTH